MCRVCAANGGRRPTTVAPEVIRMKSRFFITLGVVAVAVGAFASSAFAVTVPDVPVSAYGSSLLTSLAAAITDVLPYAAAITAFAIGVGMLKRWLGHRKATNV
jgi:Na+/pantothenate symporter